MTFKYFLFRPQFIDFFSGNNYTLRYNSFLQEVKLLCCINTVTCMYNLNIGVISIF